MMKQKYYFTLVLSFCIFFLTLSKGQTEKFVHIYCGISEFKDSKATASYKYHSLFGLSPDINEEETSKVKFRDSTVLGGKYGEWFDDSYLGYAIDISYFKAKEDNIDTIITPISVLMLLRYPSIKLNESESSKYFIYGAIGLGYPYADITIDFRPDVSKEINGKGEGLFAEYRLGLSYKCNKRVSIFGEYRYADITLHDEFFQLLKPWEYLFSLNSDDAVIDFTINQFLIGLSYGF